MSERAASFNPKNVGGERPYSRLTRNGITTAQIAAVHGDLGAIFGTTAVHGVEPGQIAMNMGLRLNRRFINAGLIPVPMIVPFVSGDPIYGERSQRVFRDVYGPDEQRQIFLSEGLGHALLQTEFGRAGYQQHLVNVRAGIGTVQSALNSLIEEPLEVVSLDGKETRRIDLAGKRLIEINAGANATLAKDSDRVDAYEVFPVTFDGLINYVQRHNRLFGYDEQLLTDVFGVANDLRRHMRGIILPDIHTLGQEPWFENEFPEAFLTPPWKNKLTPPEVVINPRERTVTIADKTEERSTVTGYNPDKGIVYLNVSGNDMGAQSAKSFVFSAQDQGYVVAAPPWLREKWLLEEKDTDQQHHMINVLPAGPNILFAEDGDGDRLCKAFFMRLGMGSYAYAQLAGVPIIYLGFETLDNPEMHGNGAVLEANGLGIRYTGQPNVITDVQGLDANYPAFNTIVYERFGIPRHMEGIPAVGEIILLDQINKR
jgi:hypothetical protein